MAPTIRLKGPAVATETVTATSYTRIHSGETTRELIVQIKLPRLSEAHRSSGRVASSVTPRPAAPAIEEADTETAHTKEKAPVINDDSESDAASELSWLDFELNQVLESSNPTVHSSDPATAKPPATEAEADSTNTVALEPHVKEEYASVVKEEAEPLMKIETPPTNDEPAQDQGPKEVEYRKIPPNLLVLLRREFGAGNEQDDLGIIEKMIFTLRDPLSATRIKLPVKSHLCQHFECFDFNNFCLFNHMATGVQSALKKELMKKNLEQKKREKNQRMFETAHHMAKLMNPINIVQFKPRGSNYPQYPHVHTYKPAIPSYKCPICNAKFELHQLYISDVFNFFVKTTPSNIDRIELRDLNRYRIVEDQVVTPTASLRRKHQPGSVQPEEIITLSDDEDDSPPAAKPETNDENEPSPYSSDEETEEEYDPRMQRKYDLDEEGIDSFFRHLAQTGPTPQAYPQSAFPPHRPPEADSYQGSGSWEDPVTLD